MKNSRKNNKELARLVGVSQPTVKRLIKKLEMEGYVREYTVIPDFSKLGFCIMAMTFVKWPKKFTEEEYDRIVKAANRFGQEKEHEHHHGCERNRFRLRHGNRLSPRKLFSLPRTD